MRFAHAAATAALATLALLCSAASGSAMTNAPGGVQAPSVSQPAGDAAGAPVPVHTATRTRPVLSSFTVPKAAVAGRPPRVALRVDESGVASVYVRVTVSASATGRTDVIASLGWVRTGRTIGVAWPAHATLAPGSYQVSVTAHDRRGAVLQRGSHISAVASLTVDAPVLTPAKAPVPLAPAAPAPIVEAGVPSIAQTVTDGAVFPVAGPHNFGGPENVFGAPRDGYLHQGQDVLTAEGTPVVAPLAGKILTTSYQEDGAGYYAVQETAIGFDFMFAHCEAASLVVSTGQTVAAGQVLCRAGETGDATAPHLDFEMWVGGWQAAGGHPINPLPYLEAWEG